METRLLDIVAHPDDLETTMAYAVKKSDRVIIATNGTATTVNYLPEPRFIVDGGRKDEAIAGQESLGIRSLQQYYLGLPDGDLSLYTTELATRILKIVHDENISHLRTMGEGGVDGHPDHIATHNAAVMAQKLALQHHRSLSIFALNEAHIGKIVFPATNELRKRKLAAMACHTSQFPIMRLKNTALPPNSIALGDTGFAVDKEWWESFTPYTDLIMKGETYDLIAR